MTNEPKDPFEEAMAEMGLGPTEASRDREDEERALFEAVMANGAGVAPTASPEPTEDETGKTPVNSARGLRRLIRQGSLQPTQTLDLHQMTREEALRATTSFLARSRREGHQLVRIICGRGIHSREGAVLPDALDGWLKNQLAEHVTLSMPALGNDGGSGARYVLLRG